MILPSYSSIKCILVGSPRNGEEHDLACIDDKGRVPCSSKEWLDCISCPTCGKWENYCLTYRLKWTDPPEFEKDGQGRAVMYWKDTGVDWNMVKENNKEDDACQKTE